MSEKEKPPQTPSPSKIALPPEEEVRNRIQELEKAILKITGEIRSLKGKIDNNNPAEIAEIQAQNNMFQGRIESLRKALYVLTMELFSRRQPDDMKQKCEVLRLAAVEYFKNSKVNQEIWKNIES